MSKFMRCNMDAALFQVNARSETTLRLGGLVLAPGTGKNETCGRRFR